MTDPRTPALLRLGTVKTLVYAQLANGVAVAKKVFNVAHGTHGTDQAYTDNGPEQMQTQSHIDIQEIVGNIPHSEKWEFIHVVSIVQTPKFQDALFKVNNAQTKTKVCVPPGIKTKVCVYFLTNGCNFDLKECKFAHSEDELAPEHKKSFHNFRTQLCDNPECNSGAKCIFAHGRHKLRQPARPVAVCSDDPTLDWTAFKLDFYHAHVEAVKAAELFVPHAATDLLSAVKALLFFRNVTEHLPIHVLKTGISVATYNFMLHVITVAGMCLATALDKDAVIAFEKYTAALLSDPKLVGTHSALAATAATFTPAAAAFTVAPAAESKCKDWSVEQVIAFFEECKFPTEGVRTGLVDGESLESICAEEDAEAIFCAPVPDGFGFGRLMYVGRFKKEMAALNVSFKNK